MRTPSAHELIKLKITAFLFNSRADALRGEIYRALCLHVLDEVQEDCGSDEIVQLVAYALGKGVKVTDSLKTIVFDELRRLTEDKTILCNYGYYRLNVDEAKQLPDQTGQEQLYKAIMQELRGIALSLNPGLSRAQIRALFDFYMEASNQVAQYQLRFVSRGLGIQEIELDDQVAVTISEYRKHYKVGEFIDVDQFIMKSLIRPTEVLSNYLYRLIQVNVITQLLAWDPALEYLQNEILSAKTLYLDSNVLFALTLISHPLHSFLDSLLNASHNDLGVTLRVHEITLSEYQNVINWANAQFSQYSRTLRDIARTCKRHNENPADYVESSIYADYISNNLDRVDLGSWQGYISSIDGRSLMDTLESFPVEIDRVSAYVPQEEFWNIKTALVRASRIQMETGKRSYVKSDPDHDAKLYYLVDSVRSRKHHDAASFGYDTYLLTLDGSLVHFKQLYKIPFSETYFVYPNQWYELSFPFLRIRPSETPDFVAGLASLIFSRAFPDLRSLVPLELCSYVFEAGGTDLPMGSVRNLVEGLFEEKMVEVLDPANEDRRAREEARLRVQRMVAEEELRRSQTVQELESKVSSLEKETEMLKGEHGHLETSVEELRTTREVLSKEIAEKETDIEKYGEIDAKLAAIESRYEEQITALEARQAVEQEALQRKLEEEKERERTSLESKLEDVNAEIGAIRQRYEASQEEKAKTERERVRKMLVLQKSVVTVIMLSGLLVSLALLIDFDIHIWIIVASICLMAVGLPMYISPIPNLWSFVAYGLGVVIAGGVILVRQGLETWLWVIPMAWEIVVLAIDRIIGRQTSV